MCAAIVFHADRKTIGTNGVRNTCYGSLDYVIQSDLGCGQNARLTLWAAQLRSHPQQSGLALTGFCSDLWSGIVPARALRRQRKGAFAMVARTIPVDPFDLVIFGGTGDLARRKILPSLFRRRLAGQMPGDARVIGCARGD